MPIGVESTPSGDDDQDVTRSLDQENEPVAGHDDSLTGEILLGRYQIGRKLGRGGMGTVYQAEQLQPVQRTVALKLLGGRHLGHRRRALFEVERQMLARMQHPAIAQVFDAGLTGDGIPFFVMEYIDGAPVTRYALEHDLALERKLDLFARICDGVQHAHHKGVIHRDLKPHNILVTDVDGRPQPKIIDFGIAMVARDDMVDGAVDEEIAGTPSYMSPEQADASGHVDTRSDVYSLGIVLYQLLTGLQPETPNVTDCSPARTQRVLAPPSEQLCRHASVDKPVPAPLLRALRRELDWIVLRATDPDRAYRYDSVAALAEDVRRFLAGDVVKGVPSSRRYRLGKFARRYRMPLAAAMAALLAIVGGLLLSLYGLEQAREQRAVAELRKNELEQVVAFQQAMLKDIDVPAMGLRIIDEQRRQLARADDPDLIGQLDRLLPSMSTTDVARALLDRQVLRPADRAIDEQFADQPLLVADLRQAIGEVYFAIGRYEEAEQALRHVWQLRARELGSEHRMTSLAQVRLAMALDRGGRSQDALALFDEVRERAARHPELGLDLLAEATQGYGWILETQGQSDRALAVLQEMADRLRSEAGENDDHLHAVLNTLGTVQLRRLELEQARINLEAAVAGRQASLGENDARTLWTMLNLIGVLDELGEHERALVLFRQLLAALEESHGAEHPLTLMTLNNMAQTLIALDRLEEAFDIHRDVAEIRRRTLGALHPQTLRSQHNIAGVLIRLERYAESLALLQPVYERRREMHGADHTDTLSSQYQMVQALRGLGRYDQARRHLGEVVATREAALGRAHPDVLEGLIMLADVNAAQGRSGPARQVLEDVLERGRTDGGREVGEQSLQAAIRLARHLRAQGQDDAASQVHDRYLRPLLDVDRSALSTGQRLVREYLEAGGLPPSAAGHY